MVYMRNAKEIYLKRREKVVLWYIGKFGIWDEGKIAKLKAVKTLNSYGMLDGYTDNRFPMKYVRGTNLPECNAYTTCSEVDNYWRYWASTKSEKRVRLIRDIIFLILGAVITSIFDHAIELEDFVRNFFGNNH